MINTKKLLIRLGLYWIISMSGASLTISLISFFAPFTNIDEYSWHDIIYYESKYIILALKLILFLSSLFAIIGFVINYITIRKFQFFIKYLKPATILLNMLLVILIPILWKISGRDVVPDIYTYVLPTYCFFLIVTGWIVFPTGKKIQSQ